MTERTDDAPGATPYSAPPAGGYSSAGTGHVDMVSSRGTKADLGKRAIAAVIDGVIGMVIGFIPIIGGLAAAGYWLVRDGLEIEFMDRRSIGKKIMKLRPVRLDGQPMDIATSARRSWMFAIGGLMSLLMFIPILGWILNILLIPVALVIGLVELYKVATDAEGRRFGDTMAGTRVVEVDA